MKRPTIKTVIADDEAELDAKTAAAQVRPPVQIDIEDYTAGGKLKLDPGEPTIPADGDDKQAEALPPPSEEPIDVIQYEPNDALNVLNARRAKIHEQQRAANAPPRVPDVFPPNVHTRYESRIRIVEAWQYNGNLAEAPIFVDRSWAAWGDWDEERKIEPGPALRVPMQQGRETEKLCRKGDYVVKQEVRLTLTMAPDVVLEVWRREDFEKFFLPSGPLGGDDTAAAGQPAEDEGSAAA